MHALLTWAQKPAWDALDEWTARLTALSLRMLGTDAHANGKTVQSSLYTIKIIRGCTGIHQIMMFVAAVIAFPCRWRAKISGIGIGGLALLLLTQVRLVSLCYVGRFFPAQFEFAHMVIWQSLVVIITVVLWALWAIVATRDHETRPS
jgi:exosortase H (IPTLxxWG-CTERM-specific)